MQALETEICVVGGGLAGLTAAAAFQAAGCAVSALAPSERGGADDPRTAALMPETVSLLRSIGAWRACAGAATPLRAMRLIDDTAETTFTAAEMGADALAWNVPHAAMTAALRAAAEQSGAGFGPTQAIGLRPAGSRARVLMSDSRTLLADLVVAADGAQSRMRQAAGIAARRWSYGLSALVFMADADHPHGEISIERYLDDGSITLVPTGDALSIVWIGPTAAAAVRRDLSDAKLQEAATAASHGDLGRLRPRGPRVVYPLSGLIAKRYGRARTALVGESGHRMPPLGSQGFNLTARDIIALRDLVTAARHDGMEIGGQPLLAKYDRMRRPDVTSRVFAVDALTKLVAAGDGPLSHARRFGLRALGGPVGPLRRALMREGMEPRLARFGA